VRRSSSLGGHSNRRKNKLLIILKGVFRRAQTVDGLAVNPPGQGDPAAYVTIRLGRCLKGPARDD
jgi:hypothetical protein